MNDPLAVALAALELCEALLLTLVEKGALSREEAVALVANAREAKETFASQERSQPHQCAGSILVEIENSLGASGNRSGEVGNFGS
jgi:hypothetical protein